MDISQLYFNFVKIVNILIFDYLTVRRERRKVNKSLIVPILIYYF